MNRIKVSMLLNMLLIVLMVAACGRPKSKTLTLDELKNAEYQSEWSASGKAKLTAGVYHEKIVPDSATELVITLSEHYAIGDLNGDGPEDAAVVLISNPGGSGTFRDLAVVINQSGTPKHIATELLGDRIKVKDIEIKSGEIVVEMLKHGPKDPMPQPTLSVIQTYKVQEDRLVRTKDDGN